jgi:ribosomal protein S18 acetylase RimI-like enzyme
MKVRVAVEEDAQQLSDLILASGPQSFSAIFDFNEQRHCKRFLLSALSKEHGQFGYANHWVVEHKGLVIGSVSAWHTELNKDFHLATLQSVIDYYQECSVDVLTHAKIVQEFIPKPQSFEWCIGHLAVLPEYQKQGAASTLLEFMAKIAQLHGKTQLSLDVPVNNQDAITFYLRMGFIATEYSIESEAMLQLGFSQHLHMQKSI